MSQQSQEIPTTNIEPMNEILFAQLRTVPILSSLKDEEILCLGGVQDIHLEAGDILTRQGDVAHFFWILLEGELRIFQTLPDNHEVTIATLPSGNAFGELPLLSNIPNVANLQATVPCHLVQFDEEQFWHLMTSCPDVRKAILGNMALRFQKLQSITIQQEKMASLGTLAAGLMHELTAKFSRTTMTEEQKQCMFDLQEHALSVKQPILMNSLEQSDAEEKLAEWMESATIDNAWKMAPTLVSVGLTAHELECARSQFPGPSFSDALNWLDALVSSMQLVSTIEESIGRVSDLVHAVKSYAYEGKGQKQTVDINNSIHATLVILAHKLREKEIVVEKDFAPDLPLLHSDCSGLNQIWTNLLDNAIDAVPQHGRIGVSTWAEKTISNQDQSRTSLCVRISDNGSGIPLDIQTHIFDPFYTTKPVGVGTGLGLGIVHRIVEQYGGAIHFTSQPGSTDFVVHLPAEATK